MNKKLIISLTLCLGFSFLEASNITKKESLKILKEKENFVICKGYGGAYLMNKTNFVIWQTKEAYYVSDSTTRTKLFNLKNCLPIIYTEQKNYFK